MAKGNKGGRPSKLQDEMSIRFAAYLAGEGKTDKQIAEKLGVTEQTINNWKHAAPQFFESLKAEKEKADAAVEKALYQRAIGYTCKDTKFATHEGMITDEKEYDKHYPPDVVAQIFWLKNRQPKKWREKIAAEDDDIDEMEFEDEAE